MNAEQHVPQFRFKDFSDSWEQRSFKTLYKKVIEKMIYLLNQTE
ncbi:hypothetical protein RWA18_14490 (plasmid) [Lacticaseibacillus paracasei]|nr:hypothetical protein [Lacticaseibacillus paracasei]WNX23459.1 hypothetical protein RWA18_14490 [Lacticaseibacillus paracasei]